jgi:hypothetical protein
MPKVKANGFNVCFFGLIALLITIALQQKELGLSKKELEYIREDLCTGVNPLNVILPFDT